MDLKVSAWPGAFVMIAATGATCFAMHLDQPWYAAWFGFVTLCGLGIYTKATSPRG